ncbi:2-amino-4-hydroxy-6-hydroxymethyldihydropteridine diphosphokinase [Vibrio genomosp. F10 str. ZF-129]|uniref:2-amino-4-hydroxy-6-hydroxymethyldihydropteridine diphosphokinase n=1 Tax=Vibrio genomosp. F10 str. ZF-129 TaxID=1187848 RepID=A0A1E5BG12_9VIBR|nr:2-amino-4-hydroxy-6-hydroxymethyldihydropteridine diphosphokinase [Vibrio genomosp. F10]OEE34812.1 2-amino-4-hydroxy-6-hydroxymethyldihydropteridine diphosphokinase [Vibrio genomosp. F10 str. ZF-129]
MHTAFISIGSNINREHHVTEALNTLEQHFSPLIVSPAYDCEPIGFIGNNFLNLVVEIQCQLTVSELANLLRQIEDNNGRIREGDKFASRTLDLDILTYDDEIGCIDGIELPRGEITQNAFVLQPLADIAANHIHPITQQTYQELWDNYDQSSQKLASIHFKWP